MSILISLAFKQIKNYLKNNILASVFVGIAIVIWIASAFMPRTVPYAGIGTNISISLNAFAFITALLVLIFAFFQAGSIFISRAEANILFITPIKDHKILIYIFLKSSYQVLIAVLLFANINNNLIIPIYHLQGGQIARLYFLEVLLVMTVVFLGIFMLLLKCKNITVFRIIEYIYLLICAVVFVYYIMGFKNVMGFSSGGGFSLLIENLERFPKYFDSYFSQNLFQYIPVAGLFINASDIVMNPNASAYISILIIIAINVLCVFSPYFIKVNFAEPALEIAEKNYKRFQRKRSGEAIKITNKAKVSIPVRLTGVNAILSKQWIDYRRSSKFFLSSNVLTIGLFMLLYTIILKVTVWGVAQDSLVDASEFIFVTRILAYIFVGVVFFISLFFVSPLPKDILNPIIYLIPHKAYKKILAVSVIANMENLIKAVLMFVFAYVSNTGIEFAFAVSVLYFLVISSSLFIDMFSYSLFLDGILFFFRALVAGIFKIIVVIIMFGIYAIFMAWDYGAGNGFNFVQVTAIIICAVIAVVIDIGIVWISEGLVEKR